MYSIILTAVCSIFLFFDLAAQVPDRALDQQQYPANNTADSKREAIFASYFEEANVSNLHVYAPLQAADHSYYFQGTELPRGLFGIFEKEWRSSMPDDFTAYALFSIRGNGKPYYLIRFAGKDTDRMIGLFEMIGDQLHYKCTLASYWCSDAYCLQKDSWLQDFDGDVRLDVLTKVKMTDQRRGAAVVDEYYSVLKQLHNGELEPDSQMAVDIADYFMFAPNNK